MSKGKHSADKKTTKAIDIEEKINIKRKKKKIKKRKKEKRRRVWLKIFVILFLASIIYLGTTFWNSNKEEKETDELLNTIEISNDVNEEVVEEKKSEMA